MKAKELEGEKYFSWACDRLKRRSPFHQLHPAVFGAAFVGGVGGDGSVEPAPKGIEAGGGDAVLTGQGAQYRGGAAAAEVEVVVGGALVVGVAYNPELELRI